MDTQQYASKVANWPVTLRANTLAPFYGPILLATIIGTLMTCGVKAKAPLDGDEKAAAVIARDVKADDNSHGGKIGTNADDK
jgi:hypothetical protein